MKKEKIEKFLLSLKGSTSSYPFGPDALVFKVMGKMFALVSQNDNQKQITVKCDPVDAGVLVSQFKSVHLGYYMNKKHWITISLNGDLSASMLTDLMNESYNLIVNKLTNKDKTKLASSDNNN